LGNSPAQQQQGDSKRSHHRDLHLGNNATTQSRLAS
jgi:hypothetical protein